MSTDNVHGHQLRHSGTLDESIQIVQKSYINNFSFRCWPELSAASPVIQVSMAHKTRVSISAAAVMVGLPRSTFYRHISEKGISINDKETNRPTVDISELTRIYGDRVKTPERLAEEKKRRNLSNATEQDNLTEEKIELLVLREKVSHIEELRRTEKAALSEQIDLLKSMLDSEKAERQQATMLLTDQRSEKERQAEKLAAVERENAAMKNAGFFARLFGFSSKSA
jgi:hypothetical protein